MDPTALLRYLLPGSCLLCDLGLAPGAGLDLCGHCAAALPWNLGGCPRCARPLPDNAGPAAVCPECQRKPPPFTRTLAPLRFEGPAAVWVRRLKDHLGMVEGRLLGTLLAEHVVQCWQGPAPPGRPDLLVPVPLGWRRLALRGHNQAVTLAVPVARRLGIPLSRRGAVRLHSGQPQRGLSRAQRLANPEGRFASRRSWEGACIGIVDDVMTTGATASALARTLLAAGAGEIQIMCATRTP